MLMERLAALCAICLGVSGQWDRPIFGVTETERLARQLKAAPPTEDGLILIADAAGMIGDSIFARLIAYPGHVSRSLLDVLLGPFGRVMARTGRGFRVRLPIDARKASTQWLLRGVLVPFCGHGIRRHQGGG